MSSASDDFSAMWSEVLELGEELVKQPDSIHLQRVLEDFVSAKFSCQTTLWFAEALYPLPGEEPVINILNDNAPLIVKRAFSNKHLVQRFRNHQKDLRRPTAIALPMITQGYQLGVIQAEKPPSEYFSKDEIRLLETISSLAGLSMQVNRQATLKNWRFEQIQLVRSVSSQIANVFNLNELCARVANLIKSSFNLYHVTIFTIDDATDKLIFRASSLKLGPNTENPFVKAESGKGLIGEAARTGQEFLITDVSDNPIYLPYDVLPNTKAEFVLPLKVENRILGVLDLQSNKKGGFHENDLIVLRALADTIAIAVENARLFNNLEQRAAQVKAVAEISSAISSILDLDQLLREVVQIIVKRFGIPYTHIFTVHSNRGKVIFEAGTGPKAAKLKPNSWAFDLDSSIGIIPHVSRTGKTYISNNVEADPLYFHSRNFSQQVKSEIAVPLLHGDTVLGVLDMQSDVLNRFTEDDRSMLETLATGIAQAIRNARLFRSERWRSSVADSFRETAGSLNSNLALPDMLNQVLAALEANLPCDASAIWLLNGDSDRAIIDRPLQLAAVRGISSTVIKETFVKSITIQSLLNTDLDDEPVKIRKPSEPIGPLGTACKFKRNYSSIAVPLRSGDEILGVMTLAHRAAGRYGKEAATISLTLANYAAVAIQNARLYSTAQEEAWSSTVLLQVAEAMQFITSVDSLFATITRLTPLLVGIDQCAIYLGRSDNETYDLKSWYGFQPASTEKIVSDADAIALLKLKATLSPVFIHNPIDELGLTSMAQMDEKRTLVLVPLLAHGDLQGGLLVSHNSQNNAGLEVKFTDQTLAILQGIAQQTAVGLENIRLLENRQEEAYITAVLLQVAQAVVSQSNLDNILDTIVQLMPILAGVDTCAIYLWDKQNLSFTPAKAVAPSRDEENQIIEQMYFSGEFPLLDKLIESDQMAACRLDDPEQSSKLWKTLECDQEYPSRTTEGSSWLLGFPLGILEEKYGVLLARETNIQTAYHQKRVELIKGVAQQTSLAIQNERLKIEMVGRERVERELQLARQIQKAFLPHTLPTLQGWDFDLRWRTAREVGGDFYDFFKTRDNRLGIVIADVADKGMPAALYMTVTRTLIRSAIQTLDSPAEVLKRVNELLVEESQNGMFVTAIFALLDPVTGIMEYANAGHNLPLLFRGNTQKIEHLKKGGIALGVVENATYASHKLKIKERDTMLLYTDGVTEAFSSTGDLFSESRLVEALRENSYEAASDLLQNLEEIIDRFRKGEPPSDDLTMLALHRLPTSQPHSRRSSPADD